MGWERRRRVSIGRLSGPVASGPSNFGTAESAIEFQHGKWRFEVRLRRSKRIFNGIWEWKEVPNMIAETVSKGCGFFGFK